MCGANRAMGRPPRGDGDAAAAAAAPAASDRLDSRKNFHVQIWSCSSWLCLHSHQLNVGEHGLVARSLSLRHGVGHAAPSIQVGRRRLVFFVCVCVCVFVSLRCLSSAAAVLWFFFFGRLSLID